MILRCDGNLLLNGLKLCLLGSFSSCLVVSGRYAFEDTNEVLAPSSPDYVLPAFHQATSILQRLSQTLSYSTYQAQCANNRDCLGYYEFCDSRFGRCECQMNAQYNNEIDMCLPCPQPGMSCTECCVRAGYECISGVCTNCYTDDGRYECDQQTVIFVTASQIALSAALIMGAVALATLLYRICTKPSYFTPRADGTMQAESAFQRISRASLTSIQVRVLSRLRDRPPKYETQHNYDTRLQNELQQQPSTTSTDAQPAAADVAIPVDAPAAAATQPRPNDISIIASQAPPTYDGTRDSLTDQPPPYSITVDPTSTQIMPMTITELIVSRPDGPAAVTTMSGEQSMQHITVSSRTQNAGVASTSKGDDEKTVHM